jgi:hypothetical protein
MDVLQHKISGHFAHLIEISGDDDLKRHPNAPWAITVLM